MRRVLVGLAALMVCGATIAPPAQASEAAPEPEPLVFTGSATVETFKPDNKTLVSRVTYGPETEGQLLPADSTAAVPGGAPMAITPMASGSGGSSTASGCRKVTVNKELLFYDYSTNDGHPKSAYKHYRQGQFENCVLKYGCIGTTYPANTLRSYYNGTWAWATNG